MSAYQVEAIETGDYTRLPQGTFLRGFVRNYAKVLGLQADSLLLLLGEGREPGKRPGIVVPSMSIRFDPLGQRLDNPYVKAVVIAFVVIALGFAAMYWWLFVRPAKSAGSAQVPVAEASSSKPARAAALPVSPRSETVAAAPLTSAPMLVPPPSVDAAKKTEPAKTPPPVNAALGSTLKFVFKGQAWVEVRDSKGRLLLSRLNPPGSDAEVSGKPPFNVVVGNAPEVQLFYNDHEFDLEPHTKVAVARFTVE
jgi:cytoskeleton protein RodZ